MKTLIASAALLAVTFTSTFASAHSMSPGYEKERAYTMGHTKTYVLTNKYQHPITLKVEVFNKDMTPAKDYRIEKDTYKLTPGSERKVAIKFKAEGIRKLVVCSTLIGVGLSLIHI